MRSFHAKSFAVKYIIYEVLLLNQETLNVFSHQVKYKLHHKTVFQLIF